MYMPLHIRKKIDEDELQFQIDENTIVEDKIRKSLTRSLESGLGA